MPIEKGRRYKDWHCTLCGRVYIKRDSTRREILNKWWSHTRKYHPKLYLQKKTASVKKMLATKRERGLIGKKSKKQRKMKNV